ncbi:hypothetical protein NE237_024714 [Protea cynaroides]|uniref:Uncharacterized protein n=1 Tax=Protea cynaroides TaxID=273540 RepID=A0A9Q0K119_9MAGN|nr:hypothetical protein NE237_024714 [Protea cynaroides]
MVEGEQSSWKLWVWVGCCGDQEMGEREYSFGKLWVWMGWKAFVPVSFRLCLPSPPMPRVFRCSLYNTLTRYGFSQGLDENALEGSRILSVILIPELIDYNSIMRSFIAVVKFLVGIFAVREADVLCYRFKVSYIRFVAKARENGMLDVA